MQHEYRLIMSLAGDILSFTLVSLRGTVVLFDDLVGLLQK